MNEFIVCWDVETTGLNPKDDFIIQLAASKFNKTTGETVEEKSWYVKPAHKYEISKGATEAHGLTKEFIEANGIYFNQVAPEFFAMIKDADLLSYNGNTFDIKFLNEECKRWGIELDIEGKMFYDSYAMECRFTPRNLSTTYLKYTGEELSDAHNALADVRATKEVFLKQMEHYNLSYNDINEYQENQLLTPDGSIRNAAVSGEDVKIVFAVGKYKDSEFMDVCKNDPGYIKWYMENVASNYTKNILKNYYKNHK